jgi:hypothetical protein
MDFGPLPGVAARRVQPARAGPRQGRDGSIGDSAHTGSSDHTPDEDSDVLRDHDADSKNEVHALDIDSSGPWPGSVTDFSAFNLMIRELVAREKAEYESPVMVGRLKYVIWNRQIASRSWGWTWRAYDGADPHTNHAHFSARYESGPESDTRPWGVAKEDDMATGEDVWKTDIIPNPKQRPDAGTNPATSAWFAVGDLWQLVYNLRDTVAAQSRALTALAGKDMTDEAAIVAGVLAGLDPAVIAAAIPADLARQVADELAARLAA